MSLQLFNHVTWPYQHDPRRSALYALNDIDVNAPAEVVWKLLIDAEHWSSYFPAEDQVKILSGESELATGTKWTRVTVGIPTRLIVTEFVPFRRISWMTVVDGDKTGSSAYHGWVITPTDAGCHVLSEETQQGPYFLEELGRKHPGGLYEYHQEWVESLTRAAENQMANAKDGAMAAGLGAERALGQNEAIGTSEDAMSSPGGGPWGRVNSEAPRRSAVSAELLDQIFRSARTYNGWTNTPVEDHVVRDIYDLLKWGPTSANSGPARFVWVRSMGGKMKLAGLASVKNRPKLLQAPLTVIVGNDLNFAAALPKLMPHNATAIQTAFAPPGISDITAMNASLQGAYLIIAARALGLDCGPMSGFDNAGVDKTFFAGTRIQSNFICAIGYGEPASVFPQNPRLSFEEAGHFG